MVNRGSHADTYTTSIRAPISPGEALLRIKDVSNWWARTYEGSGTEVGDTFTVRFTNGDRYTLRVAEADPSKMVWDVIDSYQGWVADPSEWVGTSIVWALSHEADGVAIQMTHRGLTAELECFERCSGGWNYLLVESLSRYLTEGTGLPV